MNAPLPTPETKSADGDVAAAYDEFRRTFEMFKADNDDRLRQIEMKQSADVVSRRSIASTAPSTNRSDRSTSSC